MQDWNAINRAAAQQNHSGAVWDKFYSQPKGIQNFLHFTFVAIVALVMAASCWDNPPYEFPLAPYFFALVPVSYVAYCAYKIAKGIFNIARRIFK